MKDKKEKKRAKVRKSTKPRAVLAVISENLDIKEYKRKNQIRSI